MDGKVPSRMRWGVLRGGGGLATSAVGSARRNIARSSNVYLWDVRGFFMSEPAAVARLVSTSHTWRSGTGQTVPVSRCFSILRSVSDSTNGCWVVVVLVFICFLCWMFIPTFAVVIATVGPTHCSRPECTTGWTSAGGLWWRECVMR